MIISDSGKLAAADIEKARIEDDHAGAPSRPSCEQRAC